MHDIASGKLPIEILDILPNPVLVKDCQLEYVWVNRAFEELFSVKRQDLIGQLDKDTFPDRQVAQCNGGDLRVLDSGEIDEAVETVFRKCGDPREIITRKSRLDMPDGTQYLIGIMHDITEVSRINSALQVSQNILQQQAEELNRLAKTDSLTGCGNRHNLAKMEADYFSNSARSAALLLIDIDKFKSINDNYGHDCGDTVLSQFAAVVRNGLMSGDHFLRLGGEEFAVILPDVSPAEAAQKANSLRDAVEQGQMSHEGKTIQVTVSIGVVHKPNGVIIEIGAMLSAADTLLYQAKEAGRNQVRLAA